MPHRFIKISLWVLCLLLLALCLLPLPACKKPTEPKAALPDTTSHDFVFEIDTLGNGSSSVLNDVWIFDENNIWAVGEIYLNDSTGQIDPVAYNVARWDGRKWNLMRFYYPFNQTQLLFVPIRGIYAFGANNVWLAAGSVFRWNGNYIQPFLLRSTILSGTETVEKLWGTSSSNLYGVGNSGTIVHYDGSNWQKLSSGTTVDIQDIWGEGQMVLAVASLLNYGRGLELLQIQGTSVTELDTAGVRIALSSIWFSNGKGFYLAGDGLFTKSKLTDIRWNLAQDHPTIYKRRVRGDTWNNVFVVGDFGLVSHYNGLTWRHYRERELQSFFGLWSSVAVKDDLMAAVGAIDDRAIVLRATR